MSELRLIESSKTLSNILVGADPECFIYNGSNGKVIPAATLMPEATKMGPMKLEGGTSIHWDNVCLEYDVVPANNLKDFRDSVRDSVSQAEAFVLNAMSPAKNISLLHYTVADFNSISGAPLEPSLYVFGCEPSESAWTGKKNHIDGSKTNKFRYAGGHIHLGFKEKLNKGEKRALVRTLDLLLGMRYCGVFANTQDRYRTRLYGAAGSYRVKPYGVEYRVPSAIIFNEFLHPKRLEDSFFPWMFNTALPFICENPFFADKLLRDVPELTSIIPSSINTVNKTNAKAISDTFLPIKVV